MGTLSIFLWQLIACKCCSVTLWRNHPRNWGKLVSISRASVSRGFSLHVLPLQKKVSKRFHSPLILLMVQKSCTSWGWYFTPWFPYQYQIQQLLPFIPCKSPEKNPITKNRFLSSHMALHHYEMVNSSKKTWDILSMLQKSGYITILM